VTSGSMRVKRRVWIGLIAACVGAGGWLLWTRQRPVAPTEAAQVPQSFVQLARTGATGSDQVLQEKAELLDPTPLFFPTQWNYGQQPLRISSIKQPGQFSDGFPPISAINEKNISSYGAESSAVPEKLADVLVQGNEAPFAGLGQIDRPQSSLPVRKGYIEVRNLKNGDNIASKSLTGLALPRTDFAPVEFLVVVEAGGLIGEPILTAGSGWDDVDNFFRTYLVKSYRLGEQLRPGRYRVVIGA